MKISLDKLIRRETNKLDLNFSQKIDTINYCNNNYKLSSPINIEGKVGYLDGKGYWTPKDQMNK